MYLINDHLKHSDIFKRNDTGLVGIQNMGNTCYINATLQCLFNLYNLSDFLLDNKYNKNNSYNKEIAIEFIKLNNTYWQPKTNREIITPRNFLNKVYSKDIFTYGEQNDSSEFLNFLIDCIHEYISHEVSFNIHSKTPETVIAKMRITSLRSWKKHFKNYSFFVDFTYGQYKNIFTCLNCKKETITFEPFNIVDLPIPNSHINVSIYDCLTSFSNSEILEEGKKCTKCRRNTSTKKNITIWRAPRILIICLKRFDKKLNKIHTNILFPKEKLTIFSKFSNKEFNYYLSGVVYHTGSYFGGHYYSVCRVMDKNNNLRKWVKFDDESVSYIDESRIITPNSYILFYKAF